MTLYKDNDLKKIIVTDEIKSFNVNKQEALTLEKKLNLSTYGKTWIYIGDHLYNFAIDREVDEKVLVTKFQYEYLNGLHTNKIST